jgi:hypothetical protein
VLRVIAERTIQQGPAGTDSKTDVLGNE